MSVQGIIYVATYPHNN